MEFSRPEYWSVWPFPSPGDLPNPGIEPRSPASQADSLLAEPQGIYVVAGKQCISLRKTNQRKHKGAHTHQQKTVESP